MLITRIALVSALAAGTTVSALAQTPVVAQDANPLIASSKILFNNSKNDVVKSVDKVSDDLWNWRPTPKVRTFGELFAHIADGQYEFCGAAIEGKSVDKEIEKTAKTKAAVVEALNAAFAYCEAAYSKLNDKNAAEMVTFGRPMTRIGVMDFNVAHNMEHYGNLVTYMRLKDIVPPTSKQ